MSCHVMSCRRIADRSERQHLLYVQQADIMGCVRWWVRDTHSPPPASCVGVLNIHNSFTAVVAVATLGVALCFRARGCLKSTITACSLYLVQLRGRDVVLGKGEVDAGSGGHHRNKFICTATSSRATPCVSAKHTIDGSHTNALF